MGEAAEPERSPSCRGRPPNAIVVRRIVQGACLLTFLLVGRLAAGEAPNEFRGARLFVVLDPLVSAAAALAGRAWVFSLYGAGAVLIASLFVARGFCGYVCPLGTTIDLFDWAVGRRVTRLRLTGDGWWTHLRYYLLAGVLAAALFGVVLTGFFAAIPLLARGLLSVWWPAQARLAEAGAGVPPLRSGLLLSAVLLAVVLCLGLLRPRFWCRHVCPTGALFSLVSHLRLIDRKVDAHCIGCGRCVRACPFGAIEADFSTRVPDCVSCRTCSEVCPVDAIHFTWRWGAVDEAAREEAVVAASAAGGRAEEAVAVPEASDREAVAVAEKTVPDRVRISRRGFLGGTVLGAGVALGLRGAGPRADAPVPVRPPGSVPERRFLGMCVRCGECMKACPTNVLQPSGPAGGLEGLWTPRADADRAACDPACNNCGHACPTGAIRALPLAEKRAARMGRAEVDEGICIACGSCASACPYGAIWWEPGFAPLVNEHACVGCGACQATCFAVNVRGSGELPRAAIVVQAGPGREDRLMGGSYVELHRNDPRAPLPEPADDTNFFDGVFNE